VVDGRQRTGHPRVFAAGDAVRGPDSVIWAMADGQRAALAVHAAISGEAVAMPDWTRTDYDRSTTPLRVGIAPAARRKAPHIAAARRRAGFTEVEARFRGRDAIAEASRCLQCGICCECGACVVACGEARAIDHTGRARTVALPLLAAVRTDAAEAIGAGAEHLAADGTAPSPEALLARLREDAHGTLLARRRELPTAAGVRVVLCTCNGSVHHLDLIGPLAEEIVEIPGVVGATVVNAACQPEGAQVLAAGLGAGENSRVLLAACLCCPLEILCGSCTHQRARAKTNLFSGEGIPLERLETINLRDEVLNQQGLAPERALSLARRALAAGVARALAGPNSPLWERGMQGTCPPDGRPGSGSDRGDRPAPLPLPGRALTAAAIDPARCRGCGTCAKNCPQETIAMRPRPTGIPLARVEPASCTLCGRCLAVCPVGAPDAAFAGHQQLRAALAAALAGDPA
ncbi:MAG TPA: 4Fe-4S dicluster domain-containing protein, partial [Candidatus Methanoperedens sp.]|nr:4Fe-4S dicluster domain-containing protein [Candidatus Methanoperedens sp.]